MIALIDKEIPTSRVISQIVSQHSHSQFGLSFLEFIVNRMVRTNVFKSYMIKLLAVLAYENPASQTAVLKRLVKKKRFTKRLYMD